MKKVFSAIMVIAMLATLFIPTVGAAEERTFINVLKANDGQITIDGVVNSSEWDENNKLTLSLSETSTVKMSCWAGKAANFKDFEFFYCWNDEGLYMAAKVNDDKIIATDDLVSDNANFDRFQIALNPAGIIDDKWQGMFFSFIPVKIAEGETEGVVKCIRHNSSEGGGGNDPDKPTPIDMTADGETYEGKYTLTDGGWQLEVLLPWKYIACEDRTYDLEIVDPDNDYDNVLLTNFTPNDTNRKRAFAQAFIAYVDLDAEGTTEPSATAGTFLNEKALTNWNTENYGMILKFRNADEKDATDTDIETWTRTTEGVKLNPDHGHLPTDETETMDEGGPNGDDEGDDTTAAPTGTDNSVAGTDKDGKDNKNNDNKDNNKDGNDFPWPIVLGVVAVVAVVGVVIFVVLKKKKN